MDNLEASIVVLRRLAEQWKMLSLEKPSLEALTLTLRNFKSKVPDSTHFSLFILYCYPNIFNFRVLISISVVEVEVSYSLDTEKSMWAFWGD